MSSHDVQVTGLSTSTTQATLEHFFSFCGKIESITQNAAPGEATIHFVKESAAKTALMLNGGSLDGNTLTVASSTGAKPGLAGEKVAVVTDHQEGEEVEQEDKPHSAIAAEYLAHGYLLSDAVIEKAIAADQQYGISARFLSFFTPLASKAQAVAQPAVERATTKLAEVDEKQGLSLKANAAATIGTHYYKSALASIFGSKVHAFYTNTSKQVLEVHEEATRIKESKKAAASPSASPATTDAAGLPTGGSASAVVSEKAAEVAKDVKAKTG